MKKVGFIGMGNMASAILSGIIESKYIDSANIFAYDKDIAKLEETKKKYNISLVDNEQDLVDKVDIVIFAIKPNVLEKVITKIKTKLDNKAVVSIVAGYNNQELNELLLKSTRHLTIMPNTPIGVLQGMTLFEDVNNLTSDEYEFINKMFLSVGSVQVLPTYLMAAGSALSGCGPAFVYMMIEALADGAVMQGLPREVAYKLASQTLIGAGTMQLKTNIHPGLLKDQVCSPGGITIKGVKALEDNGFRSAIINAIKKSSK